MSIDKGKESVPEYHLFAQRLILQYIYILLRWAGGYFHIPIRCWILMSYFYISVKSWILPLPTLQDMVVPMSYLATLLTNSFFMFLFLLKVDSRTLGSTTSAGLPNSLFLMSTICQLQLHTDQHTFLFSCMHSHVYETHTGVSLSSGVYIDDPTKLLGIALYPYPHSEPWLNSLGHKTNNGVWMWERYL